MDLAQYKKQRNNLDQQFPPTPPPDPVTPLADASGVASGEVVIKGNCPNCGTIVTDRDEREFHDGKYWLKKCYDERLGKR